MQIPVNELWNTALNYSGNNIADVIRMMVSDVKELKIHDERINKLLRLASCPASPIGEKTNAAKMAFTFITKHVN